MQAEWIEKAESAIGEPGLDQVFQTALQRHKPLPDMLVPANFEPLEADRSIAHALADPWVEASLLGRISSSESCSTSESSSACDTNRQRKPAIRALVAIQTVKLQKTGQPPSRQASGVRTLCAWAPGRTLPSRS